AFNRRLGSQTTVYGFVDAAAPPLVIGEHLIGLQNLFMLSAAAKFGLIGHVVNLGTHLVKGGIDPVTLGLGIFGNGLFNLDSWLVETGKSAGFALDQLQSAQPVRPVIIGVGIIDAILVNQAGIGNQFGQDHGRCLERFDFFLGIFMRFDMLRA